MRTRLGKCGGRLHGEWLEQGQEQRRECSIGGTGATEVQAQVEEEEQRRWWQEVWKS